MIERGQATIKLGLLGRRQLHLVVIQAVPKLRDQSKPFIRERRVISSRVSCIGLD